MQSPFHITIFVPSGNPDALRQIGMSNWVGTAIACPRASFAELKVRGEFAKTGAYVLRGTSEDGVPRIYIGEGDPVGPRLSDHFAKKDFWTSLIVFVSKDDTLNKAYVQYLEARLIELARSAKRCHLDNGNHPQRPSLGEAGQAEAEHFLSQMLLIYPVLGLNAFEFPRHDQPGSKLFIAAKGIRAEGADAAEGFIVIKGSEAVLSAVPSIRDFAAKLRSSLIRRKILVQKDGHLIFSQDFTFDSPSTAAGVVLGRSANGRTEWKDAEGVTLKAIQAKFVRDLV